MSDIPQSASHRPSNTLGLGGPPVSREGPQEDTWRDATTAGVPGYRTTPSADYAGYSTGRRSEDSWKAPNSRSASASIPAGRIQSPTPRYPAMSLDLRPSPSTGSPFGDDRGVDYGRRRASVPTVRPSSIPVPVASARKPVGPSSRRNPVDMRAVHWLERNEDGNGSGVRRAERPAAYRQDTGRPSRSDSVSRRAFDHWREYAGTDRKSAGDAAPELLKPPTEWKVADKGGTDDLMCAREFLVMMGRALLSFGAPSHRTETLLERGSAALNVRASFLHFPNYIIAAFYEAESDTASTRFIRAGGKVDLSSLHKAHVVYRRVLKHKITLQQGIEDLKALTKADPRYPAWMRVIFAFFMSAMICTLAFGGSFMDVWLGGAFSGLIVALELYFAHKNPIYANVFEISSAIAASFFARLLSRVEGQIFCYNAISSAGILLLLPGYTIYVASLELTYTSVLSGPVRLVYAVAYTMFLGFALSWGSELFFFINPGARKALEQAAIALEETDVIRGTFMATNGTGELQPMLGVFTFVDPSAVSNSIVQGCFRDPSWSWVRQPSPWWIAFILVPIFSTLSSLSDLQSWRSRQLGVMVIFSCATYAANEVARRYFPDEQLADIVAPAAGAFVLGLLATIYSRVTRVWSFSIMVTGILFLVPCALSGEDGLNPSYAVSGNASEQGVNRFQLGLRMIEVAVGVMLGIMVSSRMVYAIRSSSKH